MKTLSLTETQRLQIESFALVQNGNVAALRSWNRIIEAIGVPEPRKEELAYTEVQGGYVWATPEQPETAASCVLEDEDAKRLLQALEDFPAWNVRRESTWLPDLLTQLGSVV